MLSRHIHSKRQARTPIAIALGLVLSASAWAQDDPNPYYIGASQSFTRDSNLFRQTTGEVSDTISSTSLFAGVDQPFGRQRFYANGNVSANRFNNVSRLNNTGYGLNVGLDWETINNLSGRLRYSTNQSLADYGTAGTNSTAKSIERSQLALASVRYGITSRLSLEAGAQHRALDYSDPAFVSRENSQKVFNVGGRYGVSGFLTFGTGLRFTQTDTPNAAGGPDEADRKDLDLTSSWSPTGLSTINARISYSREEHSLAALSDFSGMTGSLEWVYSPTAKLRLRTSLIRDTGTEARFIDFSGGTASESTESYRITNSLQLGATYAMTAKIGLTASTRYSRGDLTSGAVRAKDSSTLTSLGINYAVARSVSLGCELSHDSRRSENAALSTPYSADLASCSAQFTYR